VTPFSKPSLEESRAIRVHHRHLPSIISSDPSFRTVNLVALTCSTLPEAVTLRERRSVKFARSPDRMLHALTLSRS
jgi:hypothetical protein